MAKYDVFVPAVRDSGMPDLNIRVEASNWLVALKESLKQVGEEGSSLGNIVCETASDGSLRVADAVHKRVFVIRQLAAEPEDDALEKEADERAAESRRLAEVAAKAKEETEFRLKAVETKMTSTVDKKPSEPAKQQDVSDEVKKLEEERAELQAELENARKKLKVAASKAAHEATGVVHSIEVTRAPGDKGGWDDLDDWYDGVEVQEDTLSDAVSDLFLATENLHEKDPKSAANEVLDLATRYIKAEASSVFYSDMKSALADLVIHAARGPVGDKIVGIRVPVGKGIVGFSVINGVKLIVNNVHKNPNFYGKLDSEFGFQTRSILCVPIQFGERTYGAIEFINKAGGKDEWTTYDANVLESLGKILGRAVDTQVATQKD